MDGLAVTTVDAVLAHCGQLASRLRTEDRREIEAMGEVPRHLLVRLYRASSIRRTVFVGGEIAAMWGCGGALLGTVGEAWLFTTHAVERVPLAFLKTARRGISSMLETRWTLISDVSADYERSIRFMMMLGFTVEAPRAIPPYGAMLRRLTLSRP